MREQVALCKGIVSGMAERSGAARAENFQSRNAAEWLRGVVSRWQASRPRASAVFHQVGPGPLPAPNVAHFGDESGPLDSEDWEEGVIP